MIDCFSDWGDLDYLHVECRFRKRFLLFETPSGSSNNTKRLRKRLFVYMVLLFHEEHEGSSWE